MNDAVARARRSLAQFTDAQRRDLARFLDASDYVRAELIRQCFERGNVGLGDLLIDLEQDRQSAAMIRLAIESMDA